METPGYIRSSGVCARADVVADVVGRRHVYGVNGLAGIYGWFVGRGFNPSWRLGGCARLYGASGTPPPTNERKTTTKNRNFAPTNHRVLAPGRGQSVRSWILKGALAKRSCEARTQAPLSRAPRLGSSGTFLLLFWSQKSRNNGRYPLKKGVTARW